MTVGERIKKIRQEKGLSQKELGKKLGVSQQMIGQYENSKDTLKHTTIYKIAEALEVPITDLLSVPKFVGQLKDGKVPQFTVPNESIRIEVTPEIIERNRIENKILNDKENVTEEEWKIIADYYNSGQLQDSYKHLSETTRKALEALLRIRTACDKLNESGQEKVAEHAEMIAKIPEYQKQPDTPRKNNPFGLYQGYGKTTIPLYIQKGHDMPDILDISAFEKGKNCISLGKLNPDIVAFLIGKAPRLSGILNPDADILFWKNRIKHTELHKADFISDNEFYNCLEQIPSIIANPDYLSVHPKDNSISFIKDFSSHVSVAIRISTAGALSYRTMYPIMDAQLTNYIDNGRAWTWKNKTQRKIQNP